MRLSWRSKAELRKIVIIEINGQEAFKVVMLQCDMERVVAQWTKEGPKGAETNPPPLAKSFNKFNPNMQALKRVSDLTIE